MALLVKIDGYDISDRVQAAVDEFDPAKAFSDPQFAGNSLTDGDLFISMTRHNREWTIPILIVADSNDNLNSTVRTINSHLKQGVTLEYREDGASNSTYFDVETAVLESDYRYQRNRQGFGKFVLRVWTRPLGHTGTTRVVATAAATGYTVMPVASMGLAGDTPAALTLVASSTGSAYFTDLVWGYAQCPTFSPRFAGTTGLFISPALAGGSVVADAVAAGTTAISAIATWAGPQIAVSLGATGSLPSYLRGQTVRVFAGIGARLQASGGASNFPAVARVITGLGSPSNGYTYSLLSSVATSTAVRIPQSSAPQLFDLGPIRIPETTEVDFVGEAKLWVTVAATNVASITNASRGLLLDEVFLLPAATSGGAMSPSSTLHTWAAITASGVRSLGASSSLGYQPGNFSARGAAPAVNPAATGAIVVMPMRRVSRSDFGYQIAAVSVSAREQFSFFR